MAVDWLRIKTEYINGGISYRKLAEKYDVSASALMQRASKEKWAKEREQQQSKTEAKTKQKAVEKISDNESEIASIKSRIRLKIYQELENRLNADGVDGADFRRLVQNYKDMNEIEIIDVSETDDDGLLEALGKNAASLFDDGDDSGMLPDEEDETE